MKISPDYIVLISANAEWRSVRKCFTGSIIHTSPYGEWFSYSFEGYQELQKPIVFLHGGWGKVAAAGSTQYAISCWHPKMVINLGTCGGFEGNIEKGTIILAEKTLIYDIFEQIGDPVEHIKHYATDIDNSWIVEPLPLAVKRCMLVSADRDLVCDEIPSLRSRFGAVAGDWESGAIAWVANKNQTHCLILRGVTDLVSATGGEAYNGNVNYYYENTDQIMKLLLDTLPHWLIKFQLSSFS